MVCYAPSMPNPALIVSSLALIVSIAVLWLTFFRRPTVEMTRPTIIALGYTESPHGLPNVSVKTLLFTTPEKPPRARVAGGRVIESMHLKLSHAETTQSFPVWYHGDERSGLFVDETGVAEEHRFFPSRSERDFRFTDGSYKVEVFACLVGDNASRRLLNPITVKVPQEASGKLREISDRVHRGVRLEFGWEPESKEYLPPVLERGPSPFPSAPDYGPPAQTLPGGNIVNPNWMLYQNQRASQEQKD